jgi:amino acid transporter
LIALAFYKGLHTPHAVLGASVHPDIPAAILVAMWNYMGWDNATTIAAEVDNPQRNYPRAMLLAALMVMLTYFLPIAAVAWAGIPADRFSTGAWADAGRLLGGPGLALFIVCAGALDSLGTFNALTLSYTRLPYAMACDGLLPKVFKRRMKNGVPWVCVLACATCWGLALDLSFERLITVDLVLWGTSLALEFVALVILRLREPDLPRPFRIPGKLWVAIALGCGPIALTLFALYVSRNERVAGISAALFSLCIVVLGVPLYGLARLISRKSLI